MYTCFVLNCNCSKLILYGLFFKTFEMEIFFSGYSARSFLRKIDNVINCNHKLVTPGFVDPHTHPVFLNEREDEFHMRLKGSTYEDIAASGGGIKTSVSDLRNADISLLVSKLKSRMDRFLRFGTTTVECKSGYGLNIKSELKSLKAIN